MKFNFFINSDREVYVCHPKNNATDPWYTKKTVKFGGGNIMVWRAMPCHGTGPLHKLEGRKEG